MARNGHKYGAVRTEVDGISFASKAEAKRYGELKLLQKAGKIKQLTLQPKYPLVVNGVKVCDYIADFEYLVLGKSWPVVEDVKGMRTTIYRLKKKLMQAIHGIEIREIGRW